MSCFRKILAFVKENKTLNYFIKFNRPDENQQYIEVFWIYGEACSSKLLSLIWKDILLYII